VRYPDGTIARIEPDSDVTLDRDRISKFMTLSLGRVSVTTSSASSGGPMIIATPLCELKAGGSSKFVLVAEPDGNRLEVESGLVLLTRTEDGASIEVSSAHYVEVNAARAMVARPSRRPERPQPVAVVDGEPHSPETTAPDSPVAASDIAAEGPAAEVVEQPTHEELLAQTNSPSGKLVAYIDAAEGEVELTQAHNGSRLSASAGTPLWLGDTIRTRLSRARVYFETGSVLHVNRFTRLKLRQRDDDFGVSVVVGEVFAEIAKPDVGFFVDTPHGTTTDLGTKFDVSVKPITGTNVFVVEGAVESSTTAGTALLGANQEVRLSSKASPPGQVRQLSSASSRLAWLDHIPGSKGRFTQKKLTDGLVAAWRFDDATGYVARNAVNRTLVGTLRGASWTTGCVGPALAFGGNDYVVVEDTAAIDAVAAEVTIAAWVRISRMRFDMKIAGRQDRPGPGYKLEVFNGKVGFDVFDGRGRTYLVRTVAGGTILRPGVWYHVAGVFSSSRGFIRTYVNGSLDREIRVTASPTVPRSAFYIGREPYANALYWNGKIDELCVFDRALDEPETKQLSVWPGIR
jgi:ferric-dicitrate binding protein FerR (iron transport regulator)